MILCLNAGSYGLALDRNDVEVRKLDDGALHGIARQISQTRAKLIEREGGDFAERGDDGLAQRLEANLLTIDDQGPVFWR